MTAVPVYRLLAIYPGVIYTSSYALRTDRNLICSLASFLPADFMDYDHADVDWYRSNRSMASSTPLLSLIAGHLVFLQHLLFTAAHRH